ncbi:putative copper-binding protein [Mycolicibacterium rhodesiae NBB3]|uniref:Putative copper-binding protein n=1 Tax=Mycolicibacterium rhodesiae (strain NBB3) TaxID=710685 RepID=G8RH24_MYCRN|nr:putative copper-binding protein [Mycolicibacterium rhodesiae NBB3]
MRHPLPTSAQLVATLAAAGIAVTACGGGTTNSSTTSAPAAPTAAEQPATTASGPPVQVQLNEFTIQLPQQNFRPGTYTFAASNEGQAPHALEIEGPGLEQATDTLSAGQSADLTVTLQPGSYKVYCPVGNHDEQGMNTTINVSG